LTGSRVITESTCTSIGEKNSRPEHYKSFGHAYRQPSTSTDYDLDDEQGSQTQSRRFLHDPLEEGEVIQDKDNIVTHTTFGDTTGILKQRRNGFAYSTDSQHSGVQLGKRVRSFSSMEMDISGPAGKARKNTSEQLSSGHSGNDWHTPSITITRPDENKKS